MMPGNASISVSYFSFSSFGSHVTLRVKNCNFWHRLKQPSWLPPWTPRYNIIPMYPGGVSDGWALLYCRHSHMIPRGTSFSSGNTKFLKFCQRFRTWAVVSFPISGGSPGAGFWIFTNGPSVSYKGTNQSLLKPLEHHVAHGIPEGFKAGTEWGPPIMPPVSRTAVRLIAVEKVTIWSTGNGPQNNRLGKFTFDGGPI